MSESRRRSSTHTKQPCRYLTTVKRPIQFCCLFSQQQLKEYEHDYNLIIRQDFDEITYQIDKFVRNQKQSYRKIRKFILNELRSQSSSSSSEDGEVDSSSSDSESFQRKRLKSHN